MQCSKSSKDIPFPSKSYNNNTKNKHIIHFYSFRIKTLIFFDVDRDIPFERDTGLRKLSLCPITGPVGTWR